MADYGGAISGIGGAVNSLFGSIGDIQEANAYGEAAKIAKSNAQIAVTSTNIQAAQSARQAFQIIGQEKAGTASAGFDINSGSAGDLLRSSAQQSSLQQGLIHVQGAITQAGFLEQASAYQGQANAAKTSSTGGMVGSALGILGSVVSLFSDRRLKRNITLLGEWRNGINLYRFSYLGSDAVYEGVMADEVEKVYPAAVSRHENGYQMVAYELIGAELRRVA